ncbi:hypothetical protein [Mariniblastus fucicola]|uniref:hypothetical protein n=1 Tax=Mariniblastus fucicola TaxID=980251 RepID=UPI0011E04816|nr:hypothetical protein [Mariniblastus fucicola]
MPLPPDWYDDGDSGRTLRDLIEQVVRLEVRAFLKRQSDRQFVRALTAREIDDSVKKGKVEMGASEVEIRDVDEDAAVSAAWVAFEDGIYLVIVDEKRYKDLDEAVFVTKDSRLTFVRLTMLSGA